MTQQTTQQEELQQSHARFMRGLDIWISQEEAQVTIVSYNQYSLQRFQINVTQNTNTSFKHTLCSNLTVQEETL